MVLTDTSETDSSDEELRADEDYQLDNFLGAIGGYTDEEHEKEGN